MMYLHREDRELFHDIILAVSEKSGLDENIIEKDYYVTLILRELALQNPKIVFKGGTSLSKAYHVIDRFSEDIDITFEEHIGEARRKKLKYKLLKSVSEKLLLPIENWDKIESDKNYNHYDFRYESVLPARKEFLYSYIKVETALMTYAYPTEKRQIDNIIYTYIKDTDYDIIAKFGLIPFEMKAQSLVRTFIGKNVMYAETRFRRNASWQGILRLGGRRVTYRSTLEFLHCVVDYLRMVQEGDWSARPRTKK